MNAALSGRTIALLTSSISRLGGGVSEAVLAQAQLIEALGGTAKVFAISDQQSAEDKDRFANFETTIVPRSGYQKLAYSKDLIPALLGSDADLLHLHGIWQYPSSAAATWAKRTGNPYLISPHGMLDQWITARGRWKKAMAKILYEWRSWRRATGFHGLTLNEADDVLIETGRGDAFVIPNPAPPPSPAVDRPDRRSRSANFLYLGRIHPKKNLEALLSAWTMLAESGEIGDAQLTIAGWGGTRDMAIFNRHLEEAPDSVRFVGEVNGSAKDDLLESARFLVLPTLGEGLPMAVLEAWAHGTPTVMSANCNLPEAFEAGAALECGIDPESVVSAILASLALDDAGWQEMSRAALGLATGRFGVGEVARRWELAYACLIDGRRVDFGQ
jgi:poly(glycerol-phosphate) alpha-glucosyltransferase